VRKCSCSSLKLRQLLQSDPSFLRAAKFRSSVMLVDLAEREGRRARERESGRTSWNTTVAPLSPLEFLVTSSTVLPLPSTGPKSGSAGVRSNERSTR